MIKSSESNAVLFIGEIDPDSMQDARLVSLLLTCIREQGIVIYNTFKSTKDEDNTYAKELRLFDEYFEPKSNVTSLTFFNRSQAPG